MAIYEDFDNGANAYFESLRKYKPLSRKEERKLLKQYKKNNDLNARNKLINSNLRYAAKLASAYRGRGLGYLELISEANSGLINSIDRFDIKRDVKLISYSKWWIMQRMQAAIEKRNKLPEAELPADDTNDESEDDADEVYKENINKFDYTAEMVDDEEEKHNEMNRFIEKMFSNLDERECDMINMYYGRLYSGSFTLEEIGEKYGLTKERVRQVIQKAFRKIRSEAILEDNYHLSSKK